MLKKKVLIAYPYWGRGGAEVATMWLIDALKHEYRVTLITRGGFDLDELNNVAGTSLSVDEFNIYGLPFKKILSRNKLGLLWHALFLRICRNIAHGYDVCITGSRVINWGRKAIHILSDVEWKEELAARYGVGIVTPKGRLYGIYKWLAKIIEGCSKHDISDDVFIANSKWTARISDVFINLPAEVVYPPVTVIPCTTAFGDRKNGFLYLGRISPEKKLETAIDILSQVRKSVPYLEFHIAGVFDDGDYSRQITKMCENHSWITLHGGVYGTGKVDLLNRYRYFINARDCEPFGISTAEMIMAGMLPFVVNDGGQTEIVDDIRLRFNSNEEAVWKISELISQPDICAQIQEELRSKMERFSALNFSRNILKTIKIAEDNLQ